MENRIARSIMTAVTALTLAASASYAMENGKVDISELSFRNSYSEPAEGRGAELLLKKSAPKGLSYKVPSYTGNARITSFSEAVSFENSSAPSATAQIGAAALMSLALHEAGHAVVADYAGADGVSLSFFTKTDNKVFLATATYKTMDRKSELPFSMGGEFASDLTFEFALQSYRQRPNVFNKALLIISGTDLLRYSAYAFYMTDGHSYYDPIAIQEHTGLSKEAIMGVAIAKTVMNAYRVYSGEDKIIPYFTVDKETAVLNFRTVF